MAKQLINLGTSANKGDGDPLRTAFDKINDNFTEVYALLGADEVDTDDVIAPMLVHNNHTNVTVTRDDDADQIIFTVDQAVTDLQGSVFGDDSTLLVDGVNSKITGEVTGTISSTNWMAASDNYLTISNGGSTGPGPIQIVASANLDLTSGSNNDINITPHGSGRVKVNDGGLGIVEAATFIGHADETMYLSSKTTGAESTHITLNSTSGVATTMYGAVDFVSGGSVDFTGSTVTGLNSTNWDTAFGWGDHSTAGYLTTETSHADVVVDGDFASPGIMATDGAGTYSIVTDNSANWDTAFAWGDHAAAGYLTSETDSQTLSLVGTDLSITNGNTVDLSGFLTSYTETDPVVGAITGIVKADGAGNITAAVDGIDYLKEETDPVVGAVNGLVKADGAGNISAAVAGTDYLTSVAFADLTATPTTIAGYGITDAFDGTYASLSGSPTALSDFTNDLDYAPIVGGAIQANGLPSGTTFTDTLTLPVLTAEPSSPVNGMVAVADGTSWDPMLNAAQTMVVYLAGAWRQIAQGGV